MVQFYHKWHGNGKRGKANLGVKIRGAGLIVKELVEEVQEGGAEGVKAVGFAFEAMGCLLDSLFG